MKWWNIFTKYGQGSMGCGAHPDPEQVNPSMTLAYESVCVCVGGKKLKPFILYVDSLWCVHMCEIISE